MIPIIDIAKLMLSEADLDAAKEIHSACIEHGFFYLAGHGISIDLQEQLLKLSIDFFNLTEEEKLSISMSKGGKAWRGYFPVGNELTSGKPDVKEGVYFGTEHDDNNPSVLYGKPFYGKNLFAENPKEFKQIVLKWMDEVEIIGHALMRGIALSLGLSVDYFDEKYTHDPLLLFRIFHYPSSILNNNDSWGVGEHTDYGLLTILKQDAIGGLEVKSKGKWIAAPYIENTFICNIGDMLEYITGGMYKSTPHRVRNTSNKSRFSFPLFFDPNVDAIIKRIDGLDYNTEDDSHERWDKSNVHDFRGTYGEYLLRKVGKVFPELSDKVL